MLVCVCRCQGVRVQLCGVVCSVSPVLEVSGSTFFILILKDPQNTQTLPVLVQVRLFMILFQGNTINVLQMQIADSFSSQFYLYLISLSLSLSLSPSPPPPSP